MRSNKRTGIMLSTRDALGREVVLTEERWHKHIVGGHPYMDGLEHAVMRVIETAGTDRPGNTPGSRVLYASGLGPARFLAVVVQYSNVPAWVITAHPASKIPKEP